MTSKNNDNNKYSISRYKNSSEKLCQYCSSCDHWTYECPHKSYGQKSKLELQKQEQQLLRGRQKNLEKQSELQQSSKKQLTSAKLSPSQMLKYGIKRKRYNFVPELTEKEEFDTNIKRVEKDLMTIAKKTKAKEIVSNTDCMVPSNINMQCRVKKEIEDEESATDQQNNDDVKSDKCKTNICADVSNVKCDLTEATDVVPSEHKVKEEQLELEEEPEIVD